MVLDIINRTETVRINDHCNDSKRWRSRWLKTSEIYIRLVIWLLVSLRISNDNKPSSLWMTGIVQRPLFVASVEETNETWTLHVGTISLTDRLFYVCLDLSLRWKALLLLFFHTELWSWFTVQISLLYQIVFMFCVLWCHHCMAWCCYL